MNKHLGEGTISVCGIKIGTCTELTLHAQFDYKLELERMVERIDILTRLRILQARYWDSPWFEGVYYGPIYSEHNATLTRITV